MRVWGALGEQTASLHMLQGAWSHLEIKRSTYNEYTPGERVKMGSMVLKTGPYKVTKHFFLLLADKLTCSLHCSGYVIFGLRD